MGLSNAKFIPSDGNYLDPDFTPSEPPNYGFKAPRKERVNTVSQEEYRLMKVPKEKRDYCTDMHIKYELCYRDMFPWVSRCSHERHSYLFCEFEDYEMRMKEYERERRLRERRKRLEVHNG